MPRDETRDAEAKRAEKVHHYALSLPAAVDERPFRPDLPVYKVGGKMFAYLSPKESPPFITLKLEPIHGQLLRSTHAAVLPGYHMNKDHWNTILLDGTIDEEEILCWIDEAYELVLAKLSVAVRGRVGQEISLDAEDANGQ